MELLQDFYETTLEALKDAKNDRLWFKTNTKLGKLYFDRTDFTKLAKILKQLHQSCQTDDGEDDLKKGTQLLEIYALEIQMYTAQKNNKKLKTLYEQSLHIKSAIPHPLIMGVIRGTSTFLSTFFIIFSIKRLQNAEAKCISERVNLKRPTPTSLKHLKTTTSRGVPEEPPA